MDTWLESLVSLDSRYLRTLVGLVRQPGVVCRDYVAGKRQRYTSPLTYFLAAITLNTLAAVGFGRLWQDPAATDSAMSSGSAAQVGLALLIPTAALWRWLFRDSGYNLAENYVFALYFFGQILLYEMLLMPFSPWLGPLNADVLIILAVIVGLFTLAGRTFYRQTAGFVLWRLVITALIVVLTAGAYGACAEWLFPSA